MLSRRLQVLVEPDQYERLERYARQEGVSVGQVVRQAIEQIAGPGRMGRAAAVEAFLGARAIPVPDDPRDLELELDGMLDAEPS